MSEQAVEVINVITTSPVIKPIIITKSIKSLTEPATPANGNQENQNDEAVKDVDALTPSKTLTTEEKLEKRIKKFGIQSENAKLNVRAQRFGVSASGGTVVDDTKLNKRAERFGTPASVTVPSTPEAAAVSAEALEKRTKRFGALTTNSSTPTDGSDPLLKRKERFGAPNEDDKKKLRSQRFEKI